MWTLFPSVNSEQKAVSAAYRLPGPAAHLDLDHTAFSCGRMSVSLLA
jgi:hypothetical protein